MNTQDLLNIILVIGFLVIVSCIVFITYSLVQALRSISKMADSLDQTAQNFREKVQLKALSALPPLLLALVSRIFKRGRG